MVILLIYKISGSFVYCTTPDCFRRTFFSTRDLQRKRKLEAERLAIEEEMRLTAKMGRGAAKREAERRLQVHFSFHSDFV